MREEQLYSSIKNCVDDWGDDFDIDIESESYWNGWAFFTVIVSHKFYGQDYEFSARVNKAGDCEMDYSDDIWQPITMGNLFAFMWFGSVEERK